MSKNKKDMQPNWRPNFRIHSTLPDIKVVRTGFVINAFALLVMIAALVFIGQREYRAQSLRSTIAGLENEIAQAEPDDNRYLKSSENFKENARHIIEVDTFRDSAFLAHELLVHLLRLKPDDLIFNRIEVNERIVKVGDKNLVQYRINLAGDVKDLPILNRFKLALQDSSVFRGDGYGSDVNEVVEGKNATTGIFPYRISIVMSPQEPTAAQGGDKS